MTPVTQTDHRRGSGLAVLIVDADRRVRSAMRQLMEATCLSADIVEAGSVAAALSAADTQSFDLALVDLLVADLESSCGLIRQLRTQSPTQVIALGVRQDDAAHAIRAGAHSFVRKSGSSEQLIQAVQAAGVSLIS
ncbi:response regulator [Rhodococcus sp. LB1]|uniref:response regulator n=1 Tax=Rhodococcus sp. LB1 TaxID=1807499 RepID=UPI0022B234D2|nr:response regulator [Rhodococcus sp. LB1]